jgi:PAS domain S-box-containing protein
MEHTTDSVLAPEYQRNGDLVKELQQVNEELALQKEMYRTLSRVSPVGMFRTDLDGNVEYVNDKGLCLMGVSKESVIKRNWADLVAEEDRERIKEGWDRCVKEQTNFVAECRFEHQNGKDYWVLCQANLVNGGGKGHVGTITDISHQKRILDQLICLKKDKLERCE